MKKTEDGLYALEVGDLAVKVSPLGAELQSIVRGGREFLWHGDPAYWGRRSPVLFPVVGSLWNGVCRFGGKEYRMSQHGFARDMVFRNVAGGEEDDTLVFALGSDGGTMERFPFGFELFVSYRLEGASVHVGWKVCNVSSGVMPFQIGGHPAFNLPVFDAQKDVYGYLGFAPADAAACARYILVAERGCVDPLHSWPLPLEAGLLPLGPHTFDRDALVVEDSGIRRVTLYDASGKPVLAVSFDAPLFGLWSPAGKRAPFVCIEPWYGRCDRKGYEGEFSGRDYVQSLAPSETFEAGYTIELL